MIDAALYSSASDEWATPQDLFGLLDKRFHFDLDVCASEENAKCERYFSLLTDQEEHTLKRPWTCNAAFMNPPYSEIHPWMWKAVLEFKKKRAETVVCLVPARTDTKWFYEAQEPASTIIFLKGRLRFGDATASAPFPSCLIIYSHIHFGIHWWDWKKKKQTL